MPKLTVRRKGYTRKAYTRKDGTRVKASRVPASTFKVKDRGKPGRTPKGERWYEPTTEMGWKKDMPMAQRRRLAVRAHGGDYLASGRALQALANVTTDRETKSKARADALYLFRMHEKTGR